MNLILKAALALTVLVFPRPSHAEVSARDKVILLELSESLTKCSAFYYVSGTLYIIGKKDQDFKKYEDYIAAMREAIIIAAALMNTANVAGSDPTRHFETYKKEMVTTIQAMDSSKYELWWDGINQKCRSESQKTVSTLRSFGAR